MADPRFPRGAKRSPFHRIIRVPPFKPVAAPPAETIRVPKQLDMWGNDQFGDCVSAEEAFAKATYVPEIFLAAQIVISWAEKHGVLNGATLTEVLDAFQHDGFKDGAQQYNDGAYHTVDYSNPDTLRAAIAVGPVKIAIDANALPQGAGNNQGWFATGGRPGQYPNTDHCVTLSSYGLASDLFNALGVPLPNELRLNPIGYLLYTWATQGFVDDAWLSSTCTEAYVRNPTTVGVPPLPPEPTPNPPTPPPPGPTPTPPIPPNPPMPPPGPQPPGDDWTIEISPVTITCHSGAPTDPRALPPWLLALVTIACQLAPSLPNGPLKTAAELLCALVPHKPHS